MRVHTLQSVSLQSAAQVADMIAIIHREASISSLTVVLSPLPGVADRLREVAKKAAAGENGHELSEIEECHFDIVRRTIDVQRQSRVIATVRQQFNQLDDLLGGIALIRELSSRTLDKVLTYGEWLSAYIFYEGLREFRSDARFLDTRQAFVTDAHFNQARIRFPESRKKILKLFEGNPRATIATGSTGATSDGDVTTFGKGGNKYAATVLAAALRAEEVIIWTDTDGIMTADPRKVPAAHSILSMSYVEALEMMHFGGDFLYPPALIPAVKHGIPILVKNTFNPEFQGTTIRENSGANRVVTGISSLDGIALLQIQGSGMIGVTGVAMRLFAALAAAEVNVILISQASSEHSICAGILEADAGRARSAVERSFKSELDEQLIDDVTVEPALAILAVVGEHMKNTMGLAARIFGTLGDAKVNIKAIAQGSSEINISMVISAVDQQKALNALHFALLEPRRGN